MWGLHRHVWAARQVEHYTSWDNRTRILDVCVRCGKQRSRSIVGTWTLEDIIGQITDRDIDRLQERDP